MAWLHPRLAAAVLFASAPAALGAQIDYRNSDRGRPTRVADAYPIERYGFEASLPYRFTTGNGVTAHVVAPELEYGIGRSLEVEVGLEWLASRTGTAGGGSHVAANVLYNPRRETLRWPALSVGVEVGHATAGSFPEGLTVVVNAFATRSVGRARLHLNGGWTAIDPDAAQNAISPQWWAGLGWDVTLYRTSTLLAAEVTVERDRAGEPLGWAFGLAARRQLTPTVVLFAGAQQALRRVPGSSEVTIGLSRAFAIAGLLPRRRP
jgi:hypothetical protein